MLQQEAESFVFYESFYESISYITDPEQKALFYDALIRYGLYGEEPQGLSQVGAALFETWRYQIDIAKSKRKKRQQAGRNGGKQNKANCNQAKQSEANQSKSKQNKANTSKMKNAQANDNVNENENDKDNENVNVNEKENVKRLPEAAEPKAAYGTYHNVFLSHSELQALKRDFSDYQAKIERLSFYKRSSRKEYADDAATIRLWAARDDAKHQDDPMDADEIKDTKEREQMLDQAWDDAIEAIWRDVDNNKNAGETA